MQHHDDLCSVYCTVLSFPFKQMGRVSAIFVYFKGFSYGKVKFRYSFQG